MKNNPNYFHMKNLLYICIYVCIWKKEIYFLYNIVYFILIYINA